MKYCAVTLMSLQEIIQSGKEFSPQQAAATLTEIIHQMLKTRYCIPQYFFQSKPTSFVQITTNPSSPLNGGQPVNATKDVGVVLKISGIISHANWKKRMYSLICKCNETNLICYQKDRAAKKILLKICIRERFSDHQLLQSMLHPEEVNYKSVCVLNQKN